MENNNNVSKKNSVSSISQTPNPNMIKRYPFNGRSKYLIDRFYIIGFKPNQNFFKAWPKKFFKMNQ